MKKPVKLTKREMEIGQAIVNGGTGRSIAAAMQLSVKTVEVHRAHINMKLGTHGIAEMIAALLVGGYATLPKRAR